MTAIRPPSEGIYRRLSVRTWGDAKFARLSPLPPSGQSLWLYLLAGPHTGQIPGVFVIGRASLAEALGWSSEDFDKAFAEVIGEELATFDARTRMWFIPKAIRHNMPSSPNVVRSWRTQWVLLPECVMRDQVFEGLKAALYGLSEAFGKAFEEACGKSSAKASPKHSAKQEAGSRKQQTPLPPDRFEEFWNAWPKNNRKAAKSSCLKVWHRKSLNAIADQILAHVTAMAVSEDWTKEAGKYVPAPLVYLNGERWDGAELSASTVNGRPHGAVLHADEQFGLEP